MQNMGVKKKNPNILIFTVVNWGTTAQYSAVLLIKESFYTAESGLALGLSWTRECGRSDIAQGPKPLLLRTLDHRALEKPGPTAFGMKSVERKPHAERPGHPPSSLVQSPPQGPGNVSEVTRWSSALLNASMWGPRREQSHNCQPTHRVERYNNPVLF